MPLATACDNLRARAHPRSPHASPRHRTEANTARRRDRFTVRERAERARARTDQRGIVMPEDRNTEHKRTETGRNVTWSPVSLLVVGICLVTIIADGYDVVVFGAVIPSLLREPGWHLTTAGAGVIGALALLGMFVGSLTVGALTDRFGRRKTLIGCLAWFSVLTGLCAVTPSPEMFGLLRFVAGLGLGGVLPTATALTGEYSDRRSRNLVYAAMLSGFPLGGILAGFAGTHLIPEFGWHAMFLIGLVPLVLVVPVACLYLPESIVFLLASGQRAEAEKIAARWHVPLETQVQVGKADVPAPASESDTGSPVARLFSRAYVRATVCFLPSTFMCLFMIYGVNTWLPEIMRRAGYPLGSALSFLLVFNIGGAVGMLVVSLAADRLGSKPILVATFLLASTSVVLLSLRLPTAALYTLVALGGVGTMGTQTFLLAYVSKHYPVRMGATAMGWTLGFGRLGSVLAPPLLGLILGSGLAFRWDFYALAVPGLLGAALITLVPRAPGTRSADGREAPDTVSPVVEEAA
ncbi:MFS transporter [Streptomyces sp. NPDC090088]|uniref:MFS transporter n=1 Tax=Streptomyces sp. NPDC090088 TaxID=3365944 RepID=UPI00380292D9